MSRWLMFVMFFTTLYSASADENGLQVGGDRTAEGCIPSAGYAYCESLATCVRPWETPCPASLPPLPLPHPSAGEEQQLASGALIPPR
mmetsp:Transcript_24094/g.54827  ORF Transcript_24094/g.54827 Transcript_24094/m.54827 type:complete len:88 (-) Transcript_24094:564-827(-)